MENQNVKSGWSKASLVFGIITMIFALLPIASAWFMLLTVINYLLAPIGTTCGVIALVKSQNITRTIIGMVLCIVAICIPFILADLYVESAAESVLDAFDSF